MRSGQNRKLRDQLNKALRRDRLEEALKLYGEIEKSEPKEPRWPHRKGDLLQRLKRKDDAVTSYERAVELYASQGFVARAAAMAKVILTLDPDRSDILNQVDPQEARKIHRATRSTVITADDADLAPADAPTTGSNRLITDALPLVADQTAAQDEVRFTAPKRRNTIELEISEIEVVERASEPPDFVDQPSFERDLPSAEELAQLPSVPLFAEVPQSVLATLVRESNLVDLEDGDRLITAGTTADALFVLVEGTVEVRGAGAASSAEPVLLSEGEVAGVSCLLSDVSYNATVTAIGSVRALRISKLLLDRLVAQHPMVGNVLLEVLSRRLISQLIRTAPMFQEFDQSTKAQVARMFEVRRANEGTVLLQAGKKSDGLYIPLLGTLSATTAAGQPMGQLKLGRGLGTHSLLTEDASTITVRATSDVLLLRMEAKRFHELVALHPRVVAHLQELARTPSQQRFSLVAPLPKKA